jgi:hypothetical protein
MYDMLRVTAGEFGRDVGRSQDLALTQPVIITRNGRDRTVMNTFASLTDLGAPSSSPRRRFDSAHINICGALAIGQVDPVLEQVVPDVMVDMDGYNHHSLAIKHS